MTKQIRQVLDWLSNPWPQVVLLLVVTIPVIWMFAKPGYFTTHDGDFHLVRLHHFLTELKAGHFPVRVVPQMAEGYSYATFNYFYPLPYLLAAIFNLLGFSLGESLKLVVVCATLLSVLGMYLWLRAFFRAWPAWLGTLVYIYVPYRMVTLYVTGQIGGALAMALVPWFLWAVTRFLISKSATHKGVYLPLVALSSAGIALSHVISVVAFGPLWLMFGVAMWWKYKLTGRELLSLVMAGVLGGAVAAFYMLPAFLETNVVKIGHEVLVKYTEHWPTFKQLVYSPWGYGYSMGGPSDGMSFQIGFGQWAVVLFSGLSLLGGLGWNWFDRQKAKTKASDLQYVQEHAVAFSMLVVFFLTVFLMIPVSKMVWEWIPWLQHLQYSWRMLAVPMVVSGYVAAWLASRGWWGYILVAGCLGLALVNNRNYLRTWEMTRYSDEHYLTNTTMVNGSTDISWEALPIAADQPPVGPAASLVRHPVATVSARPAHYHRFTLTATESGTAVLNVFAYPNWRVKVDGQNVPVTANDDGLITFELPAGEHHIELFLTSTAVQILGNTVSVLGLIVVIAWLGRELRNTL